MYNVMELNSVLPVLDSLPSSCHAAECSVTGFIIYLLLASSLPQLLCTALHPLLPLLAPCYPHALLALLLAGSYQASLSLGGLEDYLHWGPRGDGSRPTLFSANREGLVTCIGYLGIYAASIAIGKWLLKPRWELMCLPYWTLMISSLLATPSRCLPWIRPLNYLTDVP